MGLPAPIFAPLATPHLSSSTHPVVFAGIVGLQEILVIAGILALPQRRSFTQILVRLCLVFAGNVDVGVAAAPPLTLKIDILPQRMEPINLACGCWTRAQRQAIAAATGQGSVADVATCRGDRSSARCQMR
jgi:hypothetical protein